MSGLRHSAGSIRLNPSPIHRASLRRPATLSPGGPAQRWDVAGPGLAPGGPPPLDPPSLPRPPHNRHTTDIHIRHAPQVVRQAIARAGQLPLYIPNMFNGPAAGRTAGQSSRYASTGACAWYYRTAVSMLLGVRGEFDGLRLDPQLPKRWKRARVWRRFRGADFEITIVRTRRVEDTTVVLDGRHLDGTLVPLQKAGTRHQLAVTVPV